MTCQTNVVIAQYEVTFQMTLRGMRSYWRAMVATTFIIGLIAVAIDVSGGNIVLRGSMVELEARGSSLLWPVAIGAIATSLGIIALVARGHSKLSQAQRQMTAQFTPEAILWSDAADNE